MGRKALRIDAEYISSRTIEGADGCLLWDGKLSRGYGVLGSRYAHRVIYQLAKGPIPKGFSVHHLCRNKACVKIEHLSVLPQGLHVTLHNNPFAEELRKKFYSKQQAIAVSA